MREQLFHQLRKQVGLSAKRLREWFRARPHAQRRLISGGVGLALVATLALIAAMPAITSASEKSVLANGGFEYGFRQIDGCGAVGNQWECFTNGGAAAYGFYDDQWEATVYEGYSSQLIEINTKNMAAGDNDRYAGISQTARVVPGAPYKFSMRGMIRTTNSEGDPWRYSVQVGWLAGPQGDWRDVKNWQDAGWNTFYNRTEPGAFSAYQTQFVPDTEVITIFIRVWKKWGVPYEEIDVNLDAIELTGPSSNRSHDDKPAPEQHSEGKGGPVPGQEYRPEQFYPQGPQGGPQQNGPQQNGPQQNGPQQNGPQSYQEYGPKQPDDDATLACNGENLIYNGSFEGGFVDVPWGVVGKNWEAFTNGGAANYGFYDEEWDAVVADGHHGQLIEINSKAVYPTDPDRYAGISQRIGGLHPGATYELTLRALLRGVGNEDDPYRFAAQWGLGDQNNWQSVDEWTTMDLGTIAVRTEPRPLEQYKVRFEAPSQSTFLFIRGWKKWAITNVEMDLNLDAISLRSCDSPHPQPYPGTGGPVPQGGNPGQGHPHDDSDDYHHDDYYHDGECYYIVQPGDTLSQIAQDFGVSMEAIAQANGIDDPSSIYVGQKFEIPGCEEEGPGPEQEANYSQGRPSQDWQVTQGARPNESFERSGPNMRPQAEGNSENVQANGPQQWSPQEQGELTYTVQPGDMLTAIAEEYGVNTYALAEFNGIDNMNFIYTGQVLAIPY